MDFPGLFCTIRSAMPAADLTFLYGQSVPECTHYINKHFEGYQTLQYMAGGAVELRIGSNEHQLAGRWFWSCYPGPRIRFHAAAGHATWVHRYIAFRGPLVSRWVADGLFPIKPQRPPGGRDYGRRFDELLLHAVRSDRLDVIRATHTLEGILIDLAEERGRAAEPHPSTEPSTWLGQAMRLLNAAVDRGGDADYVQIASELGMAESTLRRRFRQATGTPPHAYVLQCRTARARQLLAETNLELKEIARRLGYRDVYFFCRQFRKQTGVPPGLYRRSSQG
jgi:AraC-like DNA-binding protein